MERRLSAILSYDVVGFSRAIGTDEQGTLERLKAHRDDVIGPNAARHRGRTIKSLGDGALMDFASVVDAVVFAVEVQTALAEIEKSLPESRRLLYRIGINIGDVVVERDDLYGEGVNIAVRIEQLAEPGGICIRRNVRNQIRGKLDLTFRDLGEIPVKNMERPLRVFHIGMDEKARALAAAARNSASTSELLPRQAGELPPPPDQPSIAVLPFLNLSASTDENHLSDGITEDIITELSRFRDLFVISKNSSFAYKTRREGIREIARHLGVKYILEGSVRTEGGRIRVATQLIDAEIGNHLWAERYDRAFEDLFELQDEIAQVVASTVAGRLRVSAQEGARRKPAENLGAYDYVLRGQNILGDSEANNLRARQAYEKAVEIDPTVSRAHSGLAISHMIDWANDWGSSPQRSIETALACARKAVALDSADSRARWPLGYILSLRGEFEEAKLHLERALQLNRNDADALCMMGAVLSQSGEHEEALEYLKRAMRLNPLYPSWYLWHLGSCCYNARRYPEALLAMREFISRNPDHMLPRRLLAAIHARLEHADTARAIVRECLAASPDITLRTERQRNESQYKNENDLLHLLEGLRLAGFPE